MWRGLQAAWTPPANLIVHSQFYNSVSINKESWMEQRVLRIRASPEERRLEQTKQKSTSISIMRFLYEPTTTMILTIWVGSSGPARIFLPRNASTGPFNSAATTKYQQITCLFIAVMVWHSFVRHQSQHYAWSSTTDNGIHASCGDLVPSHFGTVMPALNTDGCQSW